MKKLIIASTILLPLLLQGCYPTIEKNQSAATIKNVNYPSQTTLEENAKKYISEYKNAVLEYGSCTEKTKESKGSQDSDPKQDDCDRASLKSNAIKTYNDINYGAMDVFLKKEGITYRHPSKTLTKKYGFEDEVGEINAYLFTFVFSDDDFNTAANIYGESHQYINDEFFEKVTVSEIIKNIGKVKKENLPALSMALKKHNFVYESFVVNTVPSNDFSQKEIKIDIINTLERFNCYDDAALWLNFFVKSDEKSYLDLNDKYNKVIASMDQDQISALNTKTRKFVKSGKTPPLSPSCEINEYKRFYL